MDSLGILIKSLLQAPTDADINKLKQDLEKKLSNIKINTSTSGKGVKVLDETEIVQYQKHMQNMMTNLKTKYGSLLDSGQIKKEVDAFNTALSGFGKNSSTKKDLGLQFETLTTNVRKSSSALRLATQDADSFGNTLAKDFTKFSLWFGIGTIFMSFIHGISDAITYTNQLDNSLNEIRIVTGKTQEQVTGLANSYNKLAKEMSVTTAEIASEAANLFRQGLDTSQVEERMKSIIQYAKISSISISDSDKIITATANATGEGVQKIIDIFAQLGDQTASGADEIGEALQKVASASENSNISLEKSASWIATISSITRESASTIGRSINSIISRYESIKSKGFNSEDTTKLNDVVSALSKIGITATDAQGQLRPFADVMDEVGAKFNSLSKNEQAYIATTMFGTFQRNKGLTLLRNYDQSLKNYETALNSAGTAEQKFNIYQESTQAKLDKLTASMEGFWQSSVDSSFIKGTLDSVTKLVDTFGNLQTVISLVGTGLLLWKGTAITTFFKTLPLNIKTSVTSMQLFKDISYATQLQKAGEITTNEALSLSYQSLGVAAKSAGASIWVAFASNPLGWIAIGLTTAITLMDLFNQKQEEMKQEIEQSANKAKEYSDNLQSLIVKYSELNSVVNKDDITRQQLKSTQEEIIKLLGLEKDAIDLVNGSYDDNIKKIKEKSLEELKSNQASLQSAYNLAKKEADDRPSFRGVGGEILDNSLIDTRYSAVDKLKIPSQYKDEVQNIVDSINDDNLSTDKLIKKLNDLISLTDQYGDNTTSQYNKIVSVRDKYQKLLDGENSALTDLNKNLAIQGTLQAQMTIGNPTSTNFDDFKKNAVEAIAKQQGLNKVSEDFEKIIYDQIDNMYPSLSGAANKATDGINNSTKAEEEQFAKLQTNFNNAITTLDEYKKYLDEINDKGLSKSSLQSIIKDHKELIPYLNDEKSLYSKLNELIAGQEKIATDTYNDMMLADATFSKNILNNRTTFINSIKDKYGVDLKNYATLAQGKLAIETELIKKVAGAWAKYYDTEGNLTNSFYSDMTDEELNGYSGYVQKIVENKINKGKSLENAVKLALAGVNTDFSSVINDTNFSSILKDGNGKTSGSSKTNKDINYEKYQVEKDRYAALNQALADINNSLEVNAALQEKAITTKEKVDLLDKEVSLLKQKKTATDNLTKEQQKEANELKKALSSGGLKFNGINPDFANYDAIVAQKAAQINKITSTDEKSQKLRDKLKSDLDSFKAKYTSYLSILEKINGSKLDSLKLDTEINKTTSDRTKLLQDEAKAQQEVLQKANDEKLKLYEDATNTIKDLLKKQYDLEEKALDKSLDDYKEYIQGIIDQRDRLADSEDYQESVSESNTKINELNTEIDKRKMAAMQGDMVAINEIADFQKQKTEEEKNLKDKQKDWERKKTKENLEDQISYYEDYTKDQKELLDEKTTDTALQLQAEQILAQNSITAVQDTINNLFTLTEENATKAGQLIQSELISKLQQVIDIQKNIDSIKSGSTQGVEDNKSAIKAKMRVNSNAYGNASASEKKRLSDENLKLGKSIGWTRDENGVWWDETGKLAQYASGGVDDKGGLSVLHGKSSAVETIFNADQGKKLYDFVSNLPNSIISILPSFKTPQLTPVVGASNTGSLQMSNNYEINVQGSLDESIVPTIINKISEIQKIEFNKRGYFKPL